MHEKNATHSLQHAVCITWRSSKLYTAFSWCSKDRAARCILLTAGHVSGQCSTTTRPEKGKLQKFLEELTQHLGSRAPTHLELNSLSASMHASAPVRTEVHRSAASSPSHSQNTGTDAVWVAVPGSPVLLPQLASALSHPASHPQHETCESVIYCTSKIASWGIGRLSDTCWSVDPVTVRVTTCSCCQA